MQRVECIGAPGTGKSSLYRHLCSVRTRSWRTEKDLSYDLVPRPLRGCVQATTLLSTEVEERIVTTIRKRKSRPHAFTQNQEYAHFIADLLALFQKSSKPSWWKLAGLCSIKEILEDILFFESTHAPHERPLLVDEGVAHKAYCVLPGTDSHETKTLKHYFHHAPLPAAVLYLHASVETVYTRLSQRKKKLPLHATLTSEQLQREQDTARHIAEILANKGVSVLSLNAEQSPHDMMKKAIPFLRNLSHA
ncbi:hypothetical protein [Chitinivibrio alkaliphilus]|uniref:Uncharacterized protein n=1 Tax=Chitinivibrio alkaliphilus ACht1 TaxID=1313304 RepID=U7D6B4_9BACT|nr:hypothetical protein [Chitinivibrio alkaliphilus]ERP31478.1 hypothetical protein CALK_1682 [Chitinivibrio alkaliphilus ACht1]